MEALEQLVRTHCNSSQDRVQTLEKDNFYYRQTNRELKQKLREFMVINEKQVAALNKSQEKIRQLQAAAK